MQTCLDERGTELAMLTQSYGQLAREGRTDVGGTHKQRISDVTTHWNKLQATLRQKEEALGRSWVFFIVRNVFFNAQ